MTLSLYIARRFLWTVVRVFLAFFAILMLIDMIEQLRRFSDAGVGLAGAARLSVIVKNQPGALAAVAGTVWLLVVAPAGDPWRLTSFSIYGASLILLYAISSLSHGYEGRRRGIDGTDHITAIHFRHHPVQQ